MTGLVRRAMSLLLLPLSTLPVVAVLPELSASQERFARQHDSEALVAPPPQLTRAQLARFRPVAPFAGAIPVLAFHGINEHRDGHSVSQARFAGHLELLAHLGFETISIDEYTRWRRGESVELPPRPVLLTFDDGRLDSYRGADETLRRYGFRATIFVITGEIERKNPFYLSWSELVRMADSGRWDVQPHGHNGHRLISSDASGARGAFYAVRWFTRSAGLESLADYERRVTRDISATKDALERHGFAASTFSLPFGDDGRHAANDPRIGPLLRTFLERQFDATFVQAAGDEPAYSRREGPAERYELGSRTTTEQLYGWLTRRHPTESNEPRS